MGRFRTREPRTLHRLTARRLSVWRIPLGMALAASLVVWTTPPGIEAREPGLMRAPGPYATLRPPVGTTVAPDYLSILRRPPSTSLSSPFLGALDWYRTVLSPLDGKRCDMAPTCSLYAQQAFREEGPLLGFILTADRLLHEGDERPRTTYYVLRGQRFYRDPLSANTYWLPDWLR